MINPATRARIQRSQQLDSLEIQNFRAFPSLKIEQLGNINLIVGKNSVGKSALLEALRLYGAQGAPEVLADVLQARDEWSPRRDPARENEDVFESVAGLFYGRPPVELEHSTIRIGPLGLAVKTLTLEIGWVARKTDDSGQSSWVRIARPAVYDPNAFANDELTEVEPRLVVQYNSDKGQLLRLDRDWSRSYNRPAADSPARLAEPVYVPATGLSIEEMVRRWERISLTEAKNSVIHALQVIVPAVENLDIIGRGLPTTRPVVKAKLLDVEQPVPVRSLGEGMMRLFGLALALVTAQSAMLLIDEIDSGLHYSVQVEVWRLIFAVAKQLNVQVFATTHSWDCVAAFQQVAAEEERQEGMLIRLEREGDAVVPVLIDEETLAVVTREQIEVR